MGESEIFVSTEVLEEVQAGLRSWRTFLADHLREVKSGLRVITENLEEERRDAVRNVEHCQELIDSADDDEDTSDLHADLQDAREELQRITRMQGRQDELIGSYQREAVRMQHLISGHLPRSLDVLRQAEDSLHGLRAVQLADMGMPGSCGGASLMAGVTTATTHNTIAAEEGLLDYTTQPVPSGFQWLKLEQVKLDEVLQDVRSARDYREYADYETMINGLAILRDKVLPTIAAEGYAADSFAFSRLDRKEGVPQDKGSQRVYEAFFGDGCIAVEMDPRTGKYEVHNGRHRIRAAYDAGWLALPVKITGKTRT